jgi:hypothetical protein
MAENTNRREFLTGTMIGGSFAAGIETGTIILAGLLREHHREQNSKKLEALAKEIGLTVQQIQAMCDNLKENIKTLTITTNSGNAIEFFLNNEGKPALRVLSKGHRKGNYNG